MQFFRSLWEDDLDSAGFIITDRNNKKIRAENLVIQTDSIVTGSLKKYLKSGSELQISYFAKNTESYLLPLKEYVLFDKNGYFDPYGISWDGVIAKQRIGDLLPYEYSPIPEKNAKKH